MPKKFTEEQPESGFFDYLRFGESYTSLILGIVVVIISTILLLSFVHNKNANKNNQSILSSGQSTSVTPTQASSPSAEATVTITSQLTPTNVPTKAVVAKKPNPTPTVKATPSPTTVRKEAKPSTTVEIQGTYVVQRGDNLWSIAEKHYKSGYNWVDIARVNKLSNPRLIHAGNKLVLPKVEPKMVTGAYKLTATPTPKPTVKPTAKPTVKPTAVPTPAVGGQGKITGKEYAVVKDDNLWNIAVRAYGDGYQWVKISKANKLSNPNLIYAGSKLAIPR